MKKEYRVAVVTCSKLSGRSFVCACFDEDIKLGDTCLAIIATKVCVLGEVTEFLVNYSGVPTCDIVCVVDFEAYDKRVAARKATNGI